jgi:hypothetical protein
MFVTQAIALDPRENGALGALGGWAAKNKQMDEAEAYYRYFFLSHIHFLASSKFILSSCFPNVPSADVSSHAGARLTLMAALQLGTLTSLSCSTTRRETTRRARCCSERCSLLLRTASRTHHHHYVTTDFEFNISQLAVTTTTALCYTAWDC